MAANATVPVINGLTDRSHPCQLMADVMTFEEHRGSDRGPGGGVVGDGNNVACSWIEAAARFGFTLRIASPDVLRPPAQLLDWARAQGARIVCHGRPGGCGGGGACVVTDIWVSMADDPNESRHNLLGPYQVTPG